MWRLSENWIIEGEVESMGFDFHWFKLLLIAVVMLRVTHLCHVYSSCLSLFLSSRSGIMYVHGTGDLQGFTVERAYQQRHKRQLDQYSALRTCEWIISLCVSSHILNGQEGV